MKKRLAKKQTVKKKVVKAKKPVKKNELAELKQGMAKLKRESNLKIKTLESKLKEVTEEFGKKGAELNRLKEEVGYKNRQLASKDVEMESYRKMTEEKIFQLEARVKELVGKVAEPPAIL
jgi:chromosome segregation ATPase